MVEQEKSEYTYDELKTVLKNAGWIFDGFSWCKENYSIAICPEKYSDKINWVKLKIKEGNFPFIRRYFAASVMFSTIYENYGIPIDVIVKAAMGEIGKIEIYIENYVNMRMLESLE